MTTHQREAMTGHPIYTERWREAIRSGAASSAEVLADLIVDRFAPRTALDVGAGEGWLMRGLRTRGVDAAGVDGSWVDDPEIGHVDLTAPPFPARDRVDVVSCLEVAEHVTDGHADELVAWLCSMTSIVVFSAAIPGQGGEGHVNERWPGYWVPKFEANGFTGTGALRWVLWDDEAVSWWYRQNLLLFTAGDPERLVGLPADGCPAVVHPGCWGHHGGGKPKGRRR